MATKSRYIGEDFIEYLSDILFMRVDKFSFKTASFVKRHKKSTGHALHHVWEELAKIGQGFKKFNEDMKIYFRYHKRKMDYKYDRTTYKQDIKMRQVKSDFMKFIPFSIFMVVPGAELLLPAWLVIFPNSIPSQFLSNDA